MFRVPAGTAPVFLLTLLASELQSADPIAENPAWALITSLRGEVCVEQDFDTHDPRGFERSGGWFDQTSWSKLTAAQLGGAVQPESAVLVRHGSAEVHFQVPTVESAEGERVSSIRLLRHTAVLVSTEDSILQTQGGEIGILRADDGGVVSVRNGFVEVLHGKVRYAQWDSRMNMGFGLRNLIVNLEGTELDIEYDSMSDQALVIVHEGKVVVVGPHGSNILRAGQSARYINGKRSDDPT